MSDTDLNLTTGVQKWLDASPKRCDWRKRAQVYIRNVALGRPAREDIFISAGIVSDAFLIRMGSMFMKPTTREVSFDRARR
jgi:hypothetical protein